MKPFRLLLCVLFLISLVRAQDSVADPADMDGFAQRFTAEQLDQLLGPIALYPDALIALILPASTAPADIVLAARYLRDNPNDLSQVENRAWEDSVKSLTRYPDVLKWLDENLQWTQQVGEAFLVQPTEVMDSLQRLRAKAQVAGTLVDTPQQIVIAEPEVIRIVPAQPDTIYVPYYDPTVVFLERPVYYSRPFVTFSTGFAVGSWLAYDFDWRYRTIWMGNRFRPWYRHDWRQPLIPIRPPVFHATPPSRQWRPHRPAYTHRPGSLHPGQTHARPHRPQSTRPHDNLHSGQTHWQRPVPSGAPVTRTHSRTFASPQDRGEARVRTRPPVAPATSLPVVPPLNLQEPGVPSSSQATVVPRDSTRSRTPATLRSRTPAMPPAYTESAPHIHSPETSRIHTPRTLSMRTPASTRAISPRTHAPASSRTISPGTPRTHAPAQAFRPALSSHRPPGVGLPPQSPAGRVQSSRGSDRSTGSAAASGSRSRGHDGARHPGQPAL
jgi:hypothetical protein